MPAGIFPIRQFLFLLTCAYGYSRPRLSGRDIITQCGYSVRYRSQASFLQGNAGRHASCSPWSFAKHHRDISSRFRLLSMNTSHKRRVLRQRGQRVKVFNHSQRARIKGKGEIISPGLSPTGPSGLFLCLPCFLPFEQAGFRVFKIVGQPLMPLFGIIAGPGLKTLDKPGHIFRSECLRQRLDTFFAYFTDCFHQKPLTMDPCNFLYSRDNR